MPTSSFDAEFIISGDAARKLLDDLNDPNRPKIKLQPMKYTLEEQAKIGIALLKKSILMKDPETIPTL